MTETVRPARAPASLKHQSRWLLLGVVVLTACGIALSVGFGLRASAQAQQALLQTEAQHTQVSLARLLDYYHAMLDRVARDPELVDLMRVGTVAEQEAWAISRQRMLPDLLGIALVGPRGEVLGDAQSLRVGPRCQQDMRQAETLLDVRPLVHREIAGAEHFDLVRVVRDSGGEVLGGVFVSVRLAQVQRVLDDSLHPGHALRVVDAAGNVLAQRGAIEGARREVRLDLPVGGWTLVAQAPRTRFTASGEVQVLAALLTLAAVLLLLGSTMLRVRRAMLADVEAIRDALATLARGEPAPTVTPHYVEFEAAEADINRIARQLEAQRGQLQHLSLTDPLTGLPNRRAFETRFPQAQGLAERSHPVALVLLDIDRFKAVNDRHGHGTGDQVLLALAQSLKALTRRADLAARLAGDEFAVLLTDVDADGLTAWYDRLADHFRGALQAQGLEVESGLSAGQTWLGGGATDSIGAALRRADQALYQAKAQGRGRMARAEQAGAGDAR